MTPRLRVAVVGGGWAGLAAAVELCAAGAQVTVLESARQLGGRARSVTLDGRTLDNGQHLLLGAYREVLRLIEVVGVRPAEAFRRQALAVDFPGSGFALRLPRLPAPLNLAAGLFAARGASLAEKINAARCIGDLRRKGYRLDAEGTIGAPSVGGDTDDAPSVAGETIGALSVAEWLDRHRQHGSLRRHLWEPLCLAALNTAPEQASVQVFANVLRDALGGTRADTDLLLPAADLDRIFALPASRFIAAHGGQIHVSSRIDGIDCGAAGAPLRVGGEAYDRVILAVAPQHAAPLLARQRATQATAELLRAYAYEPIGTLYALYPPALRLPRPMLGLGGQAGGDTTGQWVFDRGQLGGERGMLAFVLSAHGDWQAHDGAQLLAALHRDLEAALGRRLPPALWHRLLRETRATFACRPGLPRPAAQSGLPGLWLAGDYCCAPYPATLEGAVRSGVAAARGALREQHTAR